MRRLSGILCSAALAGTAFAQSPSPTPLPIYPPSYHSNSYYHFKDQIQGTATAIDDLLISNPSNSANTAVRAATSTTTNLLLRSTAVSAGGKSIIEPLPPAAPGPEFYTEFEWTSIRDRRPLGPDGNKFGGLLGADFFVGDGLVLGGSLAYAYERRKTNDLPVSSTVSEFAANLYVGKNFADWVNVGLSLVYNYEDRIAKAFGMRAYGHDNVFAVSPFVGIAHTWGSFSFSSTATYIYQYTDLDLPTSVAGVDFSDRFSSHTYLHLNELGFAVTDKFTVTAIANVNVVIEQENNVITNVLGSADDFWMTWGGRLNYQFNDFVGAYAQFQADTFNENFDVYTTTVGLTLSF